MGSPGGVGGGPRAEALFREIAALPDAERAARLQALKRESPALAREVQELLATTFATMGMFETPSPDEESPGRAVPPERLGAWRLVEPLGEGGMGEVWLAERIEGGFTQQAALKLVRAAVAREHALARFRLERQVLARLNHPAIAKVLDGGIAPDGRPWFAMELVSGRAITDFVRERAASLPERLRLLIAVCEAVDFAHRNLVVHRDLKPSNIVVTDAGEPRLLDFGLAKLLEAEDDPGLTRTHMLAFTPAYAAPEQVLGGAITTATDVYALGVLLYELLTGRLPHDRGGRNPAALAEVVSHETVTRPSLALRRDLSGASGSPEALHRARSLEGDLDTIALKALHREPERRYQGAAALADDVRRFLEGRPISARPDTLGYRARRFVGRHRVGVALSALAMVSLVLGLGAALVQRDRARREADRAQTEARRAERIKSFALELISQADPTQSARGREMSAVELLHSAATQVEKGLEDEPAARTEMRVMVARGLVSLGETTEALPLLDRSIAEMRSRPTEHAMIALALHERAKALYGSSDQEGARAAAEEALSLLATDQGAAETRIRVRSTLLRLANVQGRHADAVDIGTRNLEERRALLGSDAPALAADWNNLAASQLTLDRYADAERGFREAARLLALDPKAPESRQAWIKNGLGSALWSLGRVEDARREFAQAREIAVRTLGPEHELVGLTLLNMGITGGREGRASEALALLEAARAIYAKRNHPQMARVELERGVVRLALSRDAEAERILGELVAGFAQRPQDRSEVRFRAQAALGLARARLGRPAEGAALAREGLAELEKNGLAKNDDYGLCAGYLAEILERQGAPDEARAWRERSQALLGSLMGADHPALRVQASR
jgi:eukaryotic-like serine/threonine-protein kinase